MYMYIHVYRYMYYVLSILHLHCLALEHLGLGDMHHGIEMLPLKVSTVAPNAQEPQQYWRKLTSSQDSKVPPSLICVDQ